MNEVKIENDIIVVTLKGDLDKDSVSDTADTVIKLADRIQQPKILIDFSSVRNVDFGSKSAAYEAVKQVKRSKIAIYGGDGYINGLFSLLMRFAGKTQLLKVSGNKEEALKWLSV